MKRVAIILAIVCCTHAIFAQTAKDVLVTGESRTTLINAIEKAHKQLNTLTANFTQEKSSSLFTEKVVQKGKLSYRAPKQLRWEYTSPKAMAAIFSNGKVIVKVNNKTVSNPNKMLEEMGNMIIGTINGSFLNDQNNFSSKFYKNSSNGTVLAQLTPVNKRIKTYFKSIVITLNAKTNLATKVVLTENNGDVTTITFADQKINDTLSDTLFK